MREGLSGEIRVDGSEGEGGGQIVRTALGLALATGRPVRIDQIRAGRPKPGLMRQHLAAVRAAAAVGHAEVVGAELGSRTLTFRPGRPGAVEGGDLHVAVGGAGSTSLVLQTLLPALLGARGPSHLTLEGGTHNPGAPTFEFLEHAWFPLLRRMGAKVSATLVRHGFHPAGGGVVEVTVTPAPLCGLQLVTRGAAQTRLGTAIFSALPFDVARRELAVLKECLGWDARTELRPFEVPDGIGPGNVVQATIACEHVTAVFSAFGVKGVPAETVAAEVAAQVRAWLAAEVPVGDHLADQLIVPLALAGEGAFRTMAPTAHTQTQLALVPRFLPVMITARPLPVGWEITVARCASETSRP